MQPWELEALKRSSLFNGLSDHEFETIIQYLQPVTLSFKKGQNIYLLNDTYERIGIILCGKASAYYEDATGDRMLLFTAEAGEFLGGSNLCPEKMQIFSVTVTADTNCILAFIRNSFFREVYNSETAGIEREKLLRNLLLILSEKCEYLYQRVFFISMKSILQKICSYLLTQYTPQDNSMIILPMNRKELAAYLNISRPSLSRELSYLQRKRIILFSKNTFRILDSKQLEQYAEGSLP